jgi:hypothetical protein
MQALVALDNGPQGPLHNLHYVEIDVQVGWPPLCACVWVGGVGGSGGGGGGGKGPRRGLGGG